MQTQRADLWTQWGEEKAGQTEKVTWHCTSMYKTDRYFPGSCCTGKKLSLVLCDDLEVWRRGGEAQEGEDICIYTQLIHFVVQQKPTQCCKAITLQFLKIEIKKIKLSCWQRVSSLVGLFYCQWYNNTYKKGGQELWKERAFWHDNGSRMICSIFLDENSRI